jgi:hypothetical protein
MPNSQRIEKVIRFWILGRTFGALSAQLGFWIDPKDKSGGLKQENFSLSPRLKLGACIHLCTWSKTLPPMNSVV